jgi:NAD(P)-dependent dehydrogenase (short-subunit alcohol dehydrogenase family)
MTIPFKIDLSQKTAVVTGGGGVLCSTMAEALAECGARVAILDIREDAAISAAEAIKKQGGEADGLKCDILSLESLEETNTKIKERYGPVDILVNGAGGNHPKGTTTKEFLFPEDLKQKAEDIITFYDLDPKGIEFVFALNFQGTLLPSQVFSRDMAQAGQGNIINISSMNAFTPLTKIPAYSGAKAAVSNFTQWLAVHMSKVGIRVNAIAPGFFLTDQNRALLTKDDGSLTPRGTTIISQTPMSKFGGPQDLVGALLWLVSDEASGFVTGTVIPIDGGFSAFSGV